MAYRGPKPLCFFLTTGGFVSYFSFLERLRDLHFQKILEWIVVRKTWGYQIWNVISEKVL